MTEDMSEIEEDPGTPLIRGLSEEVEKTEEPEKDESGDKLSS